MGTGTQELGGYIPARVRCTGTPFTDVPYPPCEQLLAAVIRGAGLSWAVGALLVVIPVLVSPEVMAQ